MRIEQLQIDGFGLYHDVSFGPFDPALTVITGPNEAGKSTLLAFVRAVLFGFPQRLGAEHYPPLSGGRHGGRVSIVTDAGERFTIERFQGPRRGPVTITAADGSPVDDAALPKLLGHVSGRLFSSVFAFDLQDLQQAAGGEEQEISRHIYSAGTGAGQLPAVVADLERRAAEIFVPRGQNQPVAARLRELELIESELNEVRSQSGEYGRALARREDLGREIDRLRNLIVAGGRRRATLLRYRDAQGDWNSLRGVEQRLEELPEQGSFPEDPIERLEYLENQRLEGEPLVREAAEDLKRAKEEAERPIADELLLAHSDEIETLRRGRNSFDGSVRDLPQRQAELRSMESQLQVALRQLGTGWDEAGLRDFDTSVPRLDEVEQWRQRLAGGRQLLRDREADLERERQEHRDALQEEERARELLEASPGPPLGANALQERRGMLRDVRRRHDEYVRAHERLDELAQQRSEVSQSRQVTPATVGTGVTVLLILAGLASLAIGFLAGGGGVVAILGAVLLVAAVSVLLLTRDRGRPPAWRIDVRLRLARDEEIRARGALQTAAASLELELPEEGLLDADRLDAVEAGLERTAAALAERGKLTARLEEASTRTKQRQQRVEDAEAAVERAREKLREVEVGWAGWLQARRLADTLTPETVRELFSRIETARAEARSVDKMRDRITAIERDIAKYREFVASLVEPFASDARLDTDAAVARAADALIDRFERALGERSERAARRDAIEGYERDLQRKEKRLQNIEEKIRELLSESGTDDPEEFRRRARIQAERRELESERRALAGRLHRLCGSEQGFEDLQKALAATTAEEIEVELAQAEAELEDLRAEYDATVEERGSVVERLKQLSSDETASQLRAARAQLIERLRSHAEEWSLYVIAGALLERARQRYEEERQPAVIRRAEGFFATLTGGRYRRLVAPLGEDEITVLDGSGRRKRPGQLSRGTREQLYLALRFGLIQEFGEQEERLPVIVDEVLVNFDPVRAPRGAAAFAELSRESQLLVFTCHPWVVQMFRDAAPGAPVMGLEVLKLSGEEAEPPPTS